jgi:regulator of Ty1 transposition protein 109
MAESEPLHSRLAAILPIGLDLRIYHLSTPSIATPALFAPPRQQEEEKTTRESHFLAVSSPQDGDRKEILLYAIEIYIFITESLTTIFVAKADSSGFLSRLKPAKTSSSVVAAITTTFVEFLLEPHLENSRVVLSLFARSQNQYLFPGSSENSTKHILDDRQLIRWWCRVLDSSLRQRRKGTNAAAHLIVPGCDKFETKAFFPSSSRADAPDEQKWEPSYPVELMVADPSLPPRHLIPRLPDDPKGRWLIDLDDFMDAEGHWQGVDNLDQFWEVASHRQESAAGRLVGFMWVIFSMNNKSVPAALSSTSVPCLSSVQGPRALSITPGNSQLHENGAVEEDVPVVSQLGAIGEPASPPPSLPIRASQEPNPQVQTDILHSDVKIKLEPSSLASSKKVQGEILLNAEDYEILMKHLLETDFAGEGPAADATRSWINKALELSRSISFGQSITGSAIPLAQTSVANSDDPSRSRVNVLTGVRKKRKAAAADNVQIDTDKPNGATNGTVKTLSAGLVRKKPKI